ncbi:MAG: Adenylyl cyclase class-3/4/guanylyl cyclase / Disease resistance domain-containing protein / Tetratricopeptide repeat-containing protein / Transcriptional regulator, LuxR family [uncultured Chloroflexi bacterium]|uniref:Adenylyl cyclase class-3/4/guanylyl cyclase / Disease resistance domain-containing protein / Tetratricopeptide repeat-containing protein / Transcriptional regulator, LuxR family n=1 Tax=uncultured Chloroflexota bacterium TaxID=166587 RepID=A0A6J4JSD5_9CHLR|nr:MAG: Adenylyl cyclase class-3/4/guanylyl cyclase / Disease resistance domain-containing protein / Tetratricopeptide repeat-containing protein / Transcriptional regulator, LuxR family [uncultured Chloroflexota bacterium]
MASPTHRPGNMPAEATSFIGRRRELAELRKKLTAARLVSLVGPGGVGKTRLAVRAAAGLARGFRDGAWLVELAEVRDPALVINAVMAALDLRNQTEAEPQALLLSYLRDKELLLVVDNCEHLLEAAAWLLTEVIRAALGVRVVATSREPLSVTDEHVLPIPPLELPPEHAGEPLAQVRQNDTVRLFIDRAAAASGIFELTASNLAAVVDLCRRLDGLPLAIELAAVRTRVLTVEQIRDRLTDRFALLTGGSRAALPRHQTLRTTIDWSHDLLDSAERTLLRRLCVFAGRFTLEAIESVCSSEDGPPQHALDVLSSLVDKSLVVKEDVASGARYRLHETMREYARVRLRAAGEEGRIELRCTEYYVSTCRDAATPARYRLPEWLAWLDLEIDTIRLVLRRCLDHGDLQRGIDLASSLTYFWITRATAEGVQWLDAFLAAADGTPVGTPVAHAGAYFVRGFLGVLQSDADAARPALERAIDGARVNGPLSLLSRSLSLASIAESMAGDGPSSRRLLEQAKALTAGVDDVPAMLMLLQARALGGLFEGDLDAVKSAAAEGARLGRALGDLYSLEMMLINQGLVALAERTPGVARPLFTEALRIAHTIDDRVAQSLTIAALGCHAASSGHARRAAQLFGAAETVRTGAGARIVGVLAPLVSEARQAATAALGASKFQLELTVGQQLNRRGAIALALGEPAHVAAEVPTAGPADTAPLGARESEVAQLVAEGLSNKQTGARLFISERTVESHVRSILNKLGFSSRAQIAGWIRSVNR